MENHYQQTLSLWCRYVKDITAHKGRNLPNCYELNAHADLSSIRNCIHYFANVAGIADHMHRFSECLQFLAQCANRS